MNENNCILGQDCGNIDAAEAERAAVVKWLRAEAKTLQTGTAKNRAMVGFALIIADAIESRQHLNPNAASL